MEVEYLLREIEYFKIFNFFHFVKSSIVYK